jgi:hypothetical protein
MTSFLQTTEVFGLFLVGMTGVAALLAVAMFALRIKDGWSPSTRTLGLGLIGLAIAFPIVGIGGTVVGLLTAFGAVSHVNPADKATRLAAGISEAMNCTAGGLAMAAPAVIFGLWGFLASSTKKSPPL